MSDDAKPYTSSDLPSRRAVDVVLPSRVRATVEALERVTKERDEARDFTAYLGRIGGWVSPEAFDAALREVATHSFASGRWYEMADEFDAMVSVADFDHEPIIAAAKAKHGGGK